MSLRNRAKATFGYEPKPIDEIYLIAFSHIQTERRPTDDMRLGPRMRASQVIRRTDRVLKTIQNRPDMRALELLMAARDLFLERYGMDFRKPFYFKRANALVLSDQQLSESMGAMEIASFIFDNRQMERDMILPKLDQRAKKASHALRDRGGVFTPEDYENGRQMMLDRLSLANKIDRDFDLFAGIQELLHEKEYQIGQ